MQDDEARDDMVVAMLSRGEFVLPAHYTERFANNRTDDESDERPDADR